jgi:hypothetical protein
VRTIKHTQDTFAIYQVKDGRETRDLRFEPLDRLKAAGLSVDCKNYQHVYTGTLEPGEMMPSGLWEKFNIAHPEDYFGRSISMSDVAVLRRDGKATAHYCDRDGWRETPEFLKGPYQYYSTQRPIDSNTFPKFGNEPVGFENFDRRTQVEGGAFRAWGVLTYSVPLTEKQMSDYELRAAPGNPGFMKLAPAQLEGQLQTIGKWEKAKRIPDASKFTWYYNDFGVFVKKEWVTHEQVAERYGKIMEAKARAAQKRAEQPMKGKGKMRVLLVKPNECAVEAEIENSLKALQKTVGGYIEVFKPSDDPAVYVLNEEGKIMDLDYNRGLYDRQGNLFDIIQGTFLVCGTTGDEFISLSPELMKKYKEKFFEPGISIEEVKKPFSEQMKEAEAQAAKDNAARQQADPPERDETNRS